MFIAASPLNELLRSEERQTDVLCVRTNAALPNGAGGGYCHVL
jgi:hypothetical protein